MIKKFNTPLVEMSEGSIFWRFFMWNPAPMWLVDAEGFAFFCVNEAAIRLYGYTEEEFQSMTITDIQAREYFDRPDDHHAANSIAAWQDGFFWSHLRKDASKIWVNVTGFPVLFNGKKARMVTITDVTKTVQQSIALAKANQQLEKLSLVAKLTPNAVMILDAGHSILWVNNAFTALTGYSVREAVGNKPFQLLQAPVQSTETKCRMMRAFGEKKPFAEEIILYAKTGKKFWMVANGQPVPTQDGKTAEYIVIGTEITELKQKKAAVEASEMQMNAFFENTDSLHILFDDALKVHTYNKVAQEFVGNKLGGTITTGESMVNLIPESIRQQFLQFASDALSGTATTNHEARLPLDGRNEYAWWIVSYIPAHDCFGNIMGVAFTAHDITERKKAEERIARQNRVFTDIAWKQSHLVRAPLTNILSLTSLLQTEGFDATLLTALGEESRKLDSIIIGIVHKTLEERNE